ncbi:hypothetical protein D9M71_569720 [compost metagenome]
MADERQRYRTWNGMDRPANFHGIPIMPFVGLLVGCLFTSGLGMAIFSFWVGALLAIPFLVIAFAFYFVSSLDDRFMRRVVFATRRLLLSMRFGKGLIVTPQNPKWSHFYGKRFALCRHVSRGVGSSDGASRRA